MKFKVWMSAAAVATMALGLFCFGPSPVSAEEQVTPAQVTNEIGTNRYKVFQYPGRNNSFLMYPQSYVTFDIVNGKFFRIDHPRAEYQLKRDSRPDHVFGIFIDYPKIVNYEELTVTLYTPDMKVLGIFPNVRSRMYYSIPRDGNDYERLICKIECNGEDNYDIKMQVRDAIDPVIAEPVPNERYRN